MGVTPVRALISIKIEAIGGMANNPVPLRVLRNEFGDSILGKRLTFLAERLSIECSMINSTSLPLTGSSSEIHDTLAMTSMTVVMTSPSKGIAIANGG